MIIGRTPALCPVPKRRFPMKKMNIICAFLLVLSLMTHPFSAFAEQEESLFSLMDLSIRDVSNAESIVLDNESMTISTPGIYLLSGTIQDGSLTIDLKDDEEITLLLNGVKITNTSGPALNIKGASKVILTLCEGTENTLSQGAAEPTEKKSKAAIYADSDLTINGNGSLSVSGDYKDGINCRGKLRIVSGTLTVSATDDGLVGKELVAIGSGSISVHTENGDGIKSTNKEEDSLGSISICGGIITITAGSGAETVEFPTEAFGFGPMNTTVSTDEEESSSQMGIKAAGSIVISAGSITIDSTGDAVHSDTSITISGGTHSLTTGDDALHADETLVISDGFVTIPYSYEGIEAAEIQISGGSISVIAHDDGINAAGGDTDAGENSDTSSPDSFPGFGPGRFGFESTSTGTMTISGGTITVISEGDGIDVNGDLTMSGGTVIIRGSQTGGNFALDYDGSFTLTGGTVIAAGTSDMAQGVTSTTVAGGMVSLSVRDTLTVTDSAGNEVISCVLPGTSSMLVLYSDSFEIGETYTVSSGGNTVDLVASIEATPGFSFGNFRDNRGDPSFGRRFQPDDVPGNVPPFDFGETPPDFPADGIPNAGNFPENVPSEDTETTSLIE